MTNNLQRCHWICFVLVISGWAWALPLRVVCIHSETLLDKTNFSFSSSYKLERDSELGVGAHVYFSLEYWDPIWCSSLQDLCMLPQSLKFHRFINPAVFIRPCLLGVPLLLLHSFRLVIHRVPWTLCEGILWRHLI